MSHHHTTENITCPNCGFHTTHNYCAQCGQENRLHKETFWGLVMHFAGHYFHYDSKFWKTLKALWFSPGQLTKAYWNKQRNRYIPPISLYIFVSAVFFLCTFMGGNGLFKIADTHKSKVQTEIHENVHPGDISVNINSYDTNQESQVVDFMDLKADKIQKEHGGMGEFLIEKVNHNLPKLFFFMIPVMALLLKLLFRKRKDLYFVDHAIFSLHYHSFWFSVFIVTLISMPQDVKFWVILALMAVAGTYMTVAVRNVYNTNWVRAVLSSVMVGIGYVVALFIALIIDLCIIVLLA